jgi:hypothetical protein
MKRLILIFMAFLPAAAMGQQKDFGLTNNEAGAASSAQPSTLVTGNDDGAPLEPGNTPKVNSTLTQAPNASLPQNGKQSKSSKPGDEIKRPPIAGSMVGYVDSAIVGSQVRIRFDAGFHDSAPDRAEFFYPQCACSNLGAPGPDFPGASTNINFQQLYFQAEYAPVSRFSIFTEIPFRWIEPQPGSFILGSYSSNETPSTRTNSGISDVRAGIKLALASSSNHSLTLQLKAYFPSGNGSQGLGTDHYNIEPSLLYYQRLSQRWAVESQIGDAHPIGGSMGIAAGSQTLTNFAGDVFFYGIGPSYQLIDDEHIKLAPVVELFGWHVLAGLQTLSPFPSANCGPTVGCSYDASGTNIINLKVGARTSIGSRNSVYVGFGQAVAHLVWYEHIVRIEYRYSF